MADRRSDALSSAFQDTKHVLYKLFDLVAICDDTVTSATQFRHQPLETHPSLHLDHPTQRLQRLNDLLRLLLRHPLLHHLRRALHKLLAVHQTQA